MKKDNDLPLLKFDFRKPECQVIVFPISSRVGKVRHVAGKLASRNSEEQRKSYWNLTVKNLTDELTKRGLPADEIKQQIVAFRDAVWAEMRKADAVAKQSPRPAEWDDGPRRA